MIVEFFNFLRPVLSLGPCAETLRIPSSRGQLTLRVRTANGPGFDLPHLPLLSAARICSRGFSASRPRACVPQGPKPQPTFCAYLYPRAATARCVLSICICPHAYHRYRPYGYVVADTVQLVTGWPIGQPGSPLPTRSHAHARGRAARSKGRTGLVTASDPPSRNRRQVSLAARGSRLDHTAARAQSHARLAQSYIQRQEQSCCLPVPCRAAPRQAQGRPPSLRSPEEATPSQEGPAFARASPRRDSDTENFSPAVSGRLRGAGTSYRGAGARMPVPVPVSVRGDGTRPQDKSPSADPERRPSLVTARAHESPRMVDGCGNGPACTLVWARRASPAFCQSQSSYSRFGPRAPAGTVQSLRLVARFERSSMYVLLTHKHAHVFPAGACSCSLPCASPRPHGAAAILALVESVHHQQRASTILHVDWRVRAAGLVWHTTIQCGR